MSDIVSPLLQWLNENPEWAGFATFVISAAESVAIIGTIVPGSVTMTAIGTLAGAGIIPLWATLIWAILGAIVGDGISYWLGYYFKDHLPRMWPFRNNPNFLIKGEVFVQKYGIMSVFIGRFVGPVRALVPLVAGMLGMRPLLFTIANITSAIGWAPAYMLPGILLGAASLELPPEIAMHVILTLLLITLFFILCIWIVFKLFQLIHNQTTQLQNWIWNRLKKSPYFFPATSVLKHHNPEETHGQLTLAFYLIITLILFFCLAFYVKFNGPANLIVNDAMFHLFRGLSIRSDRLDSVMIDITLLGQKQVIVPFLAIVFAWFVIIKRWRTAFHVLALGILAMVSIFVLKHFVQSSRPWGISLLDGYSMPSGHTTLATVLYIGLAFLISYSMKPMQRWLILIFAFLIAIAVGFSRLYLGAHWFTDVLGAWLLSAALLLLIVISYQRQNEKSNHTLSTFIVCIVALFFSVSLYHYKHIDDLKKNYAQINWPINEINMNDWWLKHKNEVIPAYRVSLFGFPSQRINIEWAGDLEKIKATLLKEGWSKPPARNWISTLHRMTGISSTQYLPMVSSQYLDANPALILTRPINSKKSLLVIRLWNANRIFKENNATLWVGMIGTVPRSYSWLLFRKYPGETDINHTFVFPHKKAINGWEWKILQIEFKTKKNKIVKQKIMLIRKSLTSK